MKPASEWSDSDWLTYWRTLSPKQRREIKRHAWQAVANQKEREKWGASESVRSTSEPTDPEQRTG